MAPELGEYTEQVLEELGFDAAQIDDLRANAAIPYTQHLEAAVTGGGR